MPAQQHQSKAQASPPARQPASPQAPGQPEIKRRLVAIAAPSLLADTIRPDQMCSVPASATLTPEQSSVTHIEQTADGTTVHLANGTVFRISPATPTLTVWGVDPIERRLDGREIERLALMLSRVEAGEQAGAFVELGELRSRAERHGQAAQVQELLNQKRALRRAGEQRQRLTRPGGPAAEHVPDEVVDMAVEDLAGTQAPPPIEGDEMEAARMTEETLRQEQDGKRR